MKRWVDRLEEWWTRPSQRAGSKPLPKWLLPLFPAWNLKPSQKYPVRLYLQQALTPVLFLSIIYCLVLGLCLVVVLVPLILRHPAILSNHRFQAQIAALTVKEFGWLPLVTLIYAAFSLFIYLPRFFYWNRRAKRLQQQDKVQKTTAEVLMPLPGVWPPPPNIPPHE